jgi:hypothetical protein
MRKVFILILFINLIHCNNPSNKVSDLQKNKIVVVDSSKINGSNLIFDEFKFDNVLFHNPISNNIYIYSFKKDTTYIFNNVGDNYDDYMYILKNLCFRNNHQVAVGNINNVNTYDFNGKFIEQINVKRDKKTYAPIFNLQFINDSTFVFYDAPQGDTSLPDFYKNIDTIICHYQKNSGVIKKFGFFPEENSIFKNPDYYYMYSFLFTFRLRNNNLYTISYNEPVIYNYNNITGKKEKEYSLKLKYYKPYKIKFNGNNKNLTIAKANEREKLNSEIYNFDVVDSLFYIAYNKSFDKGQVKEAIANDYDKKNCLNITSKNGTLIFDEILPDYLGKFMFADNGFLYFLGKNTEEKENKNYSTIYKAKLME